MHLNERQAIIGFNIFKTHTFFNLSELYEILTSKAWSTKGQVTIAEMCPND